MSSVYTPTATAPASGYTVPDDGDARTASSVNTPIQALADGLAYVHANRGVPVTAEVVGSSWTTTSATYVTVGGVVFSAVPQNTKYVITVSAKALIASGGASRYLRLTIVKPDLSLVTPVAAEQQSFDVNQDDATQYSFTYYYNAPAGPGIYTIKYEARNSDGTSLVTVVTGSNITIQEYRP